MTREDVLHKVLSLVATRTVFALTEESERIAQIELGEITTKEAMDAHWKDFEAFSGQGQGDLDLVVKTFKANQAELKRIYRAAEEELEQIEMSDFETD